MNISIIGTGYVGLVHGAVLSYFGNDVTCIDIDESKIERLNHLDIPIYEEGLYSFVSMGLENKTLHFSTKYDSIKESDIVFIAVGTPQKEDGSANLEYVYNAVRTISKNTGYKDLIIVTKSTVPVGTTYKIKDIISNDPHSCNIGFASNPEFLKEGCAISDSFHPDRIVIGSEEKWVDEKLTEMYKPFDSTIVHTDILSSEMIKYTSNSMLATRIGFMNEIANLCQKVGANIDDVKFGVGLDKRIGNKFLNPGCGYGGSCFPKDVRELIVTGNHNGVFLSILNAVDNSNNKQKEIPFKYLQEKIGDLKGKNICVLGAAFKPNTDDIREATSIVVINKLLENACNVNVYDPKALENVKKIFGDKIQYFSNEYEAIKNCDGVIIVTEWDEIKHMHWGKAFKMMRGNILIDGRNCLIQEIMKEIGFDYKRI